MSRTDEMGDSQMKKLEPFGKTPSIQHSRNRNNWNADSNVPSSEVMLIERFFISGPWKKTAASLTDMMNKELKMPT